MEEEDIELRGKRLIQLNSMGERSDLHLIFLVVAIVKECVRMRWWVFVKDGTCAGA